MRERHVIRLHPVMAGQQPSAKPFTNGVQAVAGGILRTLNEIGQHVFLQVTAQFAGSLELLLQTFCWDAKTRTRNLNAPSRTGRPTTPSLPTTPTSTVLPSCMGKTTEASPSSKK
jgi:hypothetical protein